MVVADAVSQGLPTIKSSLVRDDLAEPLQSGAARESMRVACRRRGNLFTQPSQGCLWSPILGGAIPHTGSSY
jgi:hypothetical protein